MPSRPTLISRRRVLAIAAGATIALPLGRLPLALAAGADNKRLDEDATVAKALSYHHDATAAPRRAFAGVAAEKQRCFNCRFIGAGPGQWRPCEVFPGRTVNIDGWCSAWAPP